MDDFFCGSGSCDEMMKQDGQETGGGGAGIQTNGVCVLVLLSGSELGGELSDQQLGGSSPDVGELSGSPIFLGFLGCKLIALVKVPPSSILEVIDITWINAVSKASAHIPVGYQEVEEAIVGHDFGSAIHSFHEVGSLERIMAM